tara:strand:- start:399 stop:626 length:228 start_codon:yes stop_codon:yes gene_type:complete
MLTFDLDEDDYEEIKSILAKNGRPDLIAVLKKARDDDYKPKEKTKEYYEYIEDYDSLSESDYEVDIDSDGFHSLK